MKVLLYDNLFYYTIMIVTYIHMQELIWAAECMHSVLPAIIRDDEAGFNSAKSELCT